MINMHFTNSIFMLEGLIGIVKEDNKLLFFYQNSPHCFDVPFDNKEECKKALKKIQEYINGI